MGTTKLNPEIDQLENMIGSTYMYRARTIKLLGYSIKDDRVEIKAKTGHPVMTSLDKLADTLDEFLPVSQELARAEKETGLQVFGNNKNNLDDLEDILLENIQKVKEDPKYIDQAKEVNSTAGTIINIAKVKVDMVREMRKLKG